MKIRSILTSSMIICMALVAHASAQWVEHTKLTASDGEPGDCFGRSIWVGGDYALVGAHLDSDNGFPSGSVYVFKREGTTWVEQSKFTASDAGVTGGLGLSICMSGDYAIVGAGEAAYIFKQDGENWIEQAKLVPSDTQGTTDFGWSVSISGEYAIVGAQFEHNGGYRCGSAYIFKSDGEAWIEQIKLRASDAEDYDHFGIGVSIDGEYAVVGAWADDDNGWNSGSTYIFNRHGTDWLEQTKIIASDGQRQDYFGEPVLISGQYAVIGSAQSAYIFKYDGAEWIEQQKLTAWDGPGSGVFGSAISVSENFCAVGAPLTSGPKSGAVYIFERDRSNWEPQAKLTSGHPDKLDGFGYSVSVSGDYCFVGAIYDDDNGYESGSVYVFQYEKPTIEAEIDIKPNTLNLRSAGKWISCEIQLLEGYDVADIDPYSVFLEDEIQVEWIWFNEAQQVAMAKFSRQELNQILAGMDTQGEVELTVTGELTDGTQFEGTDTIKVIDKTARMLTK